MNRLKLYIISTFILLGCLFWTCSEDDKLVTQQVQMHFLYNNNSLTYNTIYNVNGYNVEFTLVKMYAHFIPKDMGPYQNYYFVLSPQSSMFSLQLPPANTIEERFELYIGVPPELNTQNGEDAKPAYDYPITHPLSIANDMYWAWNPGYVFLKLEGRIDISQDGDFNDAGETFSIHTGLDPLYKNVPFAISMVNNIATISFRVNKLFVNYDLANLGKSVHPFNTSSPEYPYAQAITDNLVNAFI